AASCASTLPLHAALPFFVGVGAAAVDFQVSTGRMPMQMSGPQAAAKPPQMNPEQTAQRAAYVASLGAGPAIPTEEQVDASLGDRSEEHTSELQSRENLVC